jgi:diguanylate cyclase (GGDEF)-like protein
VPYSAGLSAAASVSFVFALASAVRLGRAAGRRTGAGRGARRLLASGTGLGAFGLLGTWALASLGWPGPVPLAPLGAGIALGAGLTLLGVLRLPGVVPVRGTAVRHLLDGALLSTCALYVSWALLIEPIVHRYLGPGRLLLTRPQWVVAAGPAAVLLAITGVLAVLAWRAPRPRHGLALTAAAVGLTGAAGVSLQLAVHFDRPGPIAALSLAFGLGQFGTARAASMTRPAPAARRPGPAEKLGLNMIITWVPVLSVIGAASVRLLLVRTIDNVSAAIAALIGLTLCARQASALREAHSYADRLATEQCRLHELAHTDALTGLGNRRQLWQVLREQAAEGTPVVLLAIDLDGFKNVNDMRGHDVGDLVLVEVADRLRAHLRGADVGVRLGGDEIAVLVLGTPDEAERVVDRLLTVLAEPYLIGAVTVALSASIGLAGGHGTIEPATLLRNADLSLRFAKQRGKNRAERFDAAYELWLHRRIILEEDLRGALDRDELSVVYQPVFALPGRRPVGVEALLRWYHPRLGAVPPAEFIPIAEQAGLVGVLDRWVLHQACHQASRWIADGLDIWVSVNISPREVRMPEFLPEVREILRAHRLPATRLVLELAEQAVAVGLDEYADRLAALRAEGIRVALDDFGAGYSSLGRLHALPVDVLKIDRSLVGAGTGLLDVAVRLGYQLNLGVIAEGVSDVAREEAVTVAGCRLAQGDLLCRPLPAEHVEALLHRAPTSNAAVARSTSGTS